MLTFQITLDPERPWNDLLDKEVVYFGNDAPPIEIVAMSEGMASGRTSISMRLDLPDGRVVIVETALYELNRVVQTLQKRFGE